MVAAIFFLIWWNFAEEDWRYVTLFSFNAWAIFRLSTAFKLVAVVQRPFVESFDQFLVLQIQRLFLVNVGFIEDLGHADERLDPLPMILWLDLVLNDFGEVVLLLLTFCRRRVILAMQLNELLALIKQEEPLLWLQHCWEQNLVALDCLEKL